MTILLFFICTYSNFFLPLRSLTSAIIGIVGGECALPMSLWLAKADIYKAFISACFGSLKSGKFRIPKARVAIDVHEYVFTHFRVFIARKEVVHIRRGR